MTFQPKQAKQPKKTGKRTRTAYSSMQLVGFERQFTASRYLCRNVRASLCEDYTLSERQVKIWFQNRRMKWKKEDKALKLKEAQLAADAKAKADASSLPPQQPQQQPPQQQPPQPPIQTGSVQPTIARTASEIASTSYGSYYSSQSNNAQNQMHYPNTRNNYQTQHQCNPQTNDARYQYNPYSTYDSQFLRQQAQLNNQYQYQYWQTLPSQSQFQYSVQSSSVPYARASYAGQSSHMPYGSTSFAEQSSSVPIASTSYAGQSSQIPHTTSSNTEQSSNMSSAFTSYGVQSSTMPYASASTSYGEQTYTQLEQLNLEPWIGQYTDPAGNASSPSVEEQRALEEEIRADVGLPHLVLDSSF